MDNGDGTISDPNTGLMWEKKDAASGIHDRFKKYPWMGTCSDVSGYCQPDAAAASTCSAATGGAVGCPQCGGTVTCNTFGYTTIWQWLNQLNASNFAGHSDWRIPTSAGCFLPPNVLGCIYSTGQAAELESILAVPYPCTGIHPCVPPAFNNNCTPGCTVANCSCTQSFYYWSASSADPTGAWWVDLGIGQVYIGSKGDDNFVRAVRGGL